MNILSILNKILLGEYRIRLENVCMGVYREYGMVYGVIIRFGYFFYKGKVIKVINYFK